MFVAVHENSVSNPDHETGELKLIQIILNIYETLKILSGDHCNYYILQYEL